MSLENYYPLEGTRQVLHEQGARHLVSDEFEHEGKKVKLEYMVYERNGVTLVWKKPLNSDTYHFHKKEQIILSREVPLSI